jgi:hypothetical protein
MYCEYKGNISNLLNSSLHVSLILECVITLTTEFKNLLTVWLVSPQNYSKTYNRMYVCKINHS